MTATQKIDREKEKEMEKMRKEYIRTPIKRQMHAQPTNAYADLYSHIFVHLTE